MRSSRELYELTEQQELLTDALVEALMGGEQTEGSVEILEEVLQRQEAEFTVVLESVAKRIKNLEARSSVFDAEKKAFKAEADRLDIRKKEIDRTVEYLEQVVRIVLDKRGVAKTTAGTFSITVKVATKKTIIDDVDLGTLDERFRKVELDKDAVTAALKAGEKLEFARIGDGKRGVLIK